MQVAKKKKDKKADKQKEIDDARQLITEYEDSISDESKISSKLTKIRELESSIENKIRKLKKQIRFYEENEHCPTCGQDLDEEKVRLELDSKRDSLTTTTNALDQLETEFTAVNSRLIEINNVHDKINKHSKLLLKNLLTCLLTNNSLVRFNKI